MRPSLIALLPLLLPAAASAQVRASEPAAVVQTVDGTKMTVEYSRPRARTRDSLFGKVVTWNEVWTPGANWATTFEVSKDVKVHGKPLPAGKYSVWIVVRKSGPWTVVLDPKNKLFHTMHPDSSATQVRFDVPPGEIPFTESLTWSFSDISGEGATLNMDWGTVRVPIDVAVISSFPLIVAADKAAAYVGNWTFAFGPNPAAANAITLYITHEDGKLIGRWEPPPFPEWERFYLIPIGEGKFIPGFLDRGKLFDVEREMPMEFTMANGKATEFKVIGGDTGGVMASGKRKP